MPTQGLPPLPAPPMALPARGGPHSVSAAALAPCVACDHFRRDPDPRDPCCPALTAGPQGGAPGAAEMPRLRAGRKRKVWPTPRSLRGTGESGEDTGHLGVTGEAILPGSPDGPLAWTGGRGWSLITATASPGRQASLRFSAGGALWRPLGAISIRGDGHGCCQGLIWPVWTGSLHCLSR